MAMKHVFYFLKQLHSFSGRILYINIICMVLIGMLEGIGILLLIPLINLSGIMTFNSYEIPLISTVSNYFQQLPETISLVTILGIYILLIVGQSLFQRNQLILNAKIQQGFVRLLKERMYHSLLQANWGFFLNKRKSDIINLMTTEINRVSGGTHFFLQFFTSLIFTLIQIGIAFWLSAKLTIFVLLFGLIMLSSLRIFIMKSTEIGNDTLQLSQTYLAGITDQFNGIKDIKSNSLELYYINWFTSLNKKIENNINDLVILKSTSQLLYKIVSSILIAIFVFFSIKMFNTQTAQLMLILIIFSRLWPRFTGIQSNLEQLGSMLPSFQAIIDLEQQCIHSNELEKLELINAKPMMIKKGIECRNVLFRYNKEQSDYALNNINLFIPVNKMTAIVGKSGAGKSTLIDILMGLNQPEKGDVLIDGSLLNKDNLISLRCSTSYVPQDPFLFNTSIRENLLVINPKASEEEIWEALELSSAADFVRKLPKGLETLIGDRGIRLSGGERQRIVLARAILRRPEILVLDEATSALDTENERKIQESLERLKGKMTIICIAHRLSTIQNADQVIVLNNGKIIQSGEYDQLANEKRGMFSTLLGKQVEAVQ
jgi:ABC-type multidrug transport system fused ATPase/permease subunit